MKYNKKIGLFSASRCTNWCELQKVSARVLMLLMHIKCADYSARYQPWYPQNKIKIKTASLLILLPSSIFRRMPSSPLKWSWYTSHVPGVTVGGRDWWESPPTCASPHEARHESRWCWFTGKIHQQKGETTQQKRKRLVAKKGGDAIYLQKLHAELFLLMEGGELDQQTGECAPSS